MSDDQINFGAVRGHEDANTHDEQFNRARSSELEYAYLPRWMPTRPRSETGFDRVMAFLGAALLMAAVVLAVARRFWA